LNAESLGLLPKNTAKSNLVATDSVKILFE